MCFVFILQLNLSYLIEIFCLRLFFFLFQGCYQAIEDFVFVYDAAFIGVGIGLAIFQVRQKKLSTLKDPPLYKRQLQEW